MTKLRVGLLIAGGALIVVLAAGATAFYVLIYRPIGSPLMAMAGGRTLEQRLQNRAEFKRPASGEPTAEQIARFVQVEEHVQRTLAADNAMLAEKKTDLEQAEAKGQLSVRETLGAFGAIKRPFLTAKAAQIDAMNRANFSKPEFEWVRRQLYRRAGLAFGQLDVSDVLNGQPNATVIVRRFTPDDRATVENQALARPLTERLQAWLTLAFFEL